MARVGIVALVACGIAALGVSPAGAQSAPTSAWRDATHHLAGFVTVAPRVRIHYLDFGGVGPPIVMLAGLGNTAHAFDNFAPALTDRHHVIALTRRGFGESSHPSGGYDTPRLVEDIRQVLDSLHLQRVTLIGHSIAGEEMTLFAARYPHRISTLIYLDAAYDRVAADSLLALESTALPDLPAAPLPAAADTATPAAYVAFVHRTRGVDIPESDIRTRLRYDGWDEEAGRAYQSIIVTHPRYRAVRSPALAIYAVTDSVNQLEPWQRADTAHARQLQIALDLTQPVWRRSRDQFRKEVAHGQVLEIRGAHHWIFVSNRDQVLAAVRRFLDSSPVKETPPM